MKAGVLHAGVLRPDLAEEQSKCPERGLCRDRHRSFRCACGDTRQQESGRGETGLLPARAPFLRLEAEDVVAGYTAERRGTSVPRRSVLGEHFSELIVSISNSRSVIFQISVGT